MNFKKYIKIVLLAAVICTTVLGAIYASSYFINGDGDGGMVSKQNKEKRVNVLLMATDKGGLLTDTMIIASFDKERNMLNMLSLPRDTKITINNKTQKLNAAYAFGEKGKRQELAIQKIKEIVNLPIHYYAVVDPEGFGKIIDILGGVEIDVPQRIKYDDPAQNLHIDLYPGVQVLDGDKAEQFCRFRKGYADQDLGRQRAQQQFLKALVEQKLKPQYILKAPELFSEASKYIDTNIGLSDVTTFLPLIKMFNAENMYSYQLPGDTKTINGASYFICDREETDKLINETFLNIQPSESPEATTASAKQGNSKK